LIQKVISIYNQTYNKDFALVSYIEDEVNFAVIQGFNIKISDVYSLGTLYGRMSVNSNL